MCDTVSVEEKAEAYFDTLYEVLDSAHLKEKDVADLKAVVIHQMAQSYGATDMFMGIRTLGALNDYVRDNL